MNYADIRPIDVANGPGVRTSIFVSGCTHHCKECFNPETWDFAYGQPFGGEQIQKIPVLAKNAVRIKCNFQNAGMTGNYECAYALGILNAQLGLPEITEYEDIAALKEQLLEKAADYKTEDAGLKQMVHLLKEYEAAPVADEQMRELFTMGFHDKNL